MTTTLLSFRDRQRLENDRNEIRNAIQAFSYTGFYMPPQPSRCLGYRSNANDPNNNKALAQSLDAFQDKTFQQGMGKPMVNRRVVLTQR